ncbi:MAG: PIN domain-containing protein [Hyphomicrobiales bacterium]|nr:PIN domain-containing protein [Hyphomicrobiales bacterium]MBV9428215.1 PIN domain-containing protein [Bradyrhizobiaceae bacterium]
MRELFADTAYWIALINPRDNLHERAISVSSQLSGSLLVTSEMILTEVLNALADYGSQVRAIAVATVQSICATPSVEVVPQTSNLFREAFNLYSSRADKDWSLTDCASLVIMRQRGIMEALTSDHHFEQSGYQALLRGPSL